MILAWTTAFAGTWVLEEDLWAEAKPPIPGAPWSDSHVRATWLVDWEPAAPSWTARLCALTLDPVAGASMSWPERSFGALPAVVRAARFDGRSFDAGPVVETLGVGDDDGDGKPGITVQVRHPRIGGGEVHVRRSVELAWTGQLDEDGAIRGTVRYSPSQDVLGATTWWLRLAIRERAHPSRPSTFTMARASDGAPCGAAP